jgi:drug/metabolite transporter (DMT)-like permease
MMDARQWLLLIALSLLWGGAFVFIEIGVEALPPLTLVFGRVGLGALGLYLLLRLRGLRLPADLATWRDFFLLGLLNNALPFTLIAWGQLTITGGLASILNATTPLFTVLLAHVMTRDERLTGGKVAGVLLGLTGVAVLVGGGALAGLGGEVLAQLAVLGAAASYALAGIFGRRFRDQPPLVTATGMVIASTVLLAPVVLLVDRPWTLAAPGATAWGAVVGLALLCTVLAYLIYFRLLATAGATNVLLVTFLIPVSAVLLGALLLGERLTAEQVVGMGLIGLGLGAVDGRMFRLLSRRHTLPAD